MLLAVALGSGVAGWYYSETSTLKRLLRGSKACAIENVPEGKPAKITGRLHLLGKVLHSPITGRSCAYYQLIVSVDNSDKYRGGWERILEEEECVDFELEDETGRALVESANSKTVAASEEIEVGDSEDASERLRSFLAARSVVAKALASGRRVQFLEAALEPGEKVSVIGIGVREVDPKAAPVGYREAPTMRLRIEGTSKRPVVISDIASVH